MADGRQWQARAKHHPGKRGVARQMSTGGMSTNVHGRTYENGSLTHSLTKGLVSILGS